MNSTISIKVGDTVFIPFWIVLEFLDAAPPDPFVKCQVINIGPRRANSPNGTIEYVACDLELGKKDLIANAIPADYLIEPSNLKEWAERIANWFKSYPDRT